MQPGFWDNQEKARKLSQELNHYREKAERLEDLADEYEELEIMLMLVEEEEDKHLEKEMEGKFKSIAKEVSGLEMEVLLGGAYDRGNAIMNLHAGAGGTEAQDWVQMLLRMYTRWAERHGYEVEIPDMLPGDEAGVKSVTLMISGPNAYGFLNSETGVHRLVRISPFDTSRRRHTSFASVEVMPLAESDDNNGDIEIKPEDLKVDTYRAGGAGGQHVNKTDSAVRITHLPTGIVVQCQNERSQMTNRNTAMKLLKAKLLDLEIRKKEEEIAKLRGDQKEIAWGSQIRSYVMHPYQMVKDHRTGMEMGNVEAFLDGQIDAFIEAFLSWQAVGKSDRGRS